MKILIIGATGMLAKPVVNHLYDKGFELKLFSRNIPDSEISERKEVFRGDIFNPSDLQMAMQGCDAVHLNLSGEHEYTGTKAVVNIAKTMNIKLISTISGCTVAEENRWYSLVDNKFKAEQCIINSGIPYMIFRPTWFFESLYYLIKNGKAMNIGNQPPYRWIAADDYARFVANAYLKDEAKNKIFFVFGQQYHQMKDLIEKFRQEVFPEIKKTTQMSLGFMKFIALLTGNKQMKAAAAMFSYFEKVKEPGSPDETDKLLGKAEILFDDWLKMQKMKSS